MKIEIDLKEITKAVAGVDGYCTVCTRNFLNDINPVVASLVVNEMKSGDYWGSEGKFVYTEGEWVEDEEA